MSQFLISAAHKSSGKTTISIGICAHLARMNLKVAPFKKGPDYIDPLWLSQASTNPCHNLDFYTQSTKEIINSFVRLSQFSDISIIEGNKGLFDGVDLEGGNSNAALAILLGSPVVLVIDTQGMTRGIAPLLLGYKMFESKLNIAGVILNKVGGARHEKKLREVVQHYTDIPIVGAVHRAKELEIVERHLGLIPSNESEKSKDKIESIRKLVADQVDFELLTSIAASASLPALKEESFEPVNKQTRFAGLRIGIAKDACFGFYYHGDLDAFKSAGVEIIYFSPMNDERLPDVDALFFGGGFPETNMAALEKNKSMRGEILCFIEKKKPVYAECGGLMYMSRSVTWKGKTCKMVGVIEGDSVMYERPQGRGYVVLKETQDFPWSAESDGDKQIYAHEFHYSRMENLASPQRFAFSVERGAGVDGSHDGIIYKNLLANYSHLRNVGEYCWVEKFLTFVLRCQRSRNSLEMLSVD